MRPYVCQRAAIVCDDITVPRCYLETDSDVITLSTGQNIRLCSASSVQVLAG